MQAHALNHPFQSSSSAVVPWDASATAAPVMNRTDLTQAVLRNPGGVPLLKVVWLAQVSNAPPHVYLQHIFALLNSCAQ